MDVNEIALKKHEEWGGKIETVSKAPVKNATDLSIAYTPGVARPCLEIEKNKEFYTEVFSKSDFEKLTGYKVTRIDGLCKNVPLLGTKMMVSLERVTEKSDVDVTA